MQYLVALKAHTLAAILLVALVAGCAASPTPLPAEAPLLSWNEGSAKAAILEFVRAVIDKNGKDYVEPAERIAVFDNDGTLWVEQPIYTQITFMFDRVKEFAPPSTRSGRRHHHSRHFWKVT